MEIKVNGETWESVFGEKGIVCDIDGQTNDKIMIIMYCGVGYMIVKVLLLMSDFTNSLI